MSIIFDFDSTIISSESLEDLVICKLKDEPEKVEFVREITEAGMLGTIDFHESLSQRLALVQLHHEEVTSYAMNLMHALTAGMRELISDLQLRGQSVWILTGSLRELVLPVGISLGIPSDQIHGVEVIWNDEGFYDKMDSSNSFSLSKIAGSRKISHLWDSPNILIGDGMTDCALKKEGAVDAFIAFTEHARRESVVQGADAEATCVVELSNLLKKML